MSSLLLENTERQNQHRSPYFGFFFPFLNSNINRDISPYSETSTSYDQHHGIASSSSFPNKAAKGVSIEISEKWSRVLVQLHDVNANIMDEDVPYSMSGTYYHGSLQNLESTRYFGHETNEERSRKVVKMTAGTDCAICFIEYKELDEVVCLPCRHVYHDACLVPWIKRSVHCPMCRCNLEHAD